MKRLFPIILLLAAQGRAQELTLDDAIALALQRNADVVVERESLNIADSAVRRAEAAYEPTLRGDARVRRRTDPVNSVLSGAPRGELAPTVTSWQSSASVVKLLPTGATVSLFSGLNRDSTDSLIALLTPSWSTALGAEVRQPLMQNRRIDPARRAIRIARVDRSRALSSFRRTATETVAAVERAYWSVVAARRDVDVRESALRVAEKQREDTKVRIEAGTQAEADLAQTTAEVERRRGELVVSRENLTRAENALRALIVRDAGDAWWDQPLIPVDAPRPPRISLTPSAAIETALANRPELEELEQRIARQDVEIEAAVDRTRPQLDLVAAYNGRGLAGDANEDAIQPFGPVTVPDDLQGGLGQSLANIGGNEFPDASVGLSLSIPIGNTAAREDAAIARAVRRQNVATMEGARQRVAVEVRNALAMVASAEQRVEASEAGRKAAEVQLQAERDRYAGGTSNLFFIITRENELAAAQTAETVALADLRKAATELARAMGTLLEERGITLTDETSTPQNATERGNR